jgi:glycosyltransferase involved in cell wall biosynthesis
MVKVNPLISIIVATYNSGNVLKDCIESVINQAYKQYELIIIDGGSTDSTLQIIDDYKEFITHWVHEKDKGIYDAWNKGVKISAGDWITFIGSDDTLYPTALADYVFFINSGDLTDYQFVSSKMHLVTQQKKIIKTLGRPWSWEKSRLENGIAHPGSIHHKSIFEQFGLFDINYKICGDYELLLRPGREIKAAFMSKITVRMAQGGISGNGLKLFKEHYHAVTTTGELNKFYATFFFILQLCKYYTKSILRKSSIDI